MTDREDALLDHYAPLEGHLAIARHLLGDAYALLGTLPQDPVVTVLRAEIAVFLRPNSSPGGPGRGGAVSRDDGGEAVETVPPTD